jgi:hypothetical protein
MARLSWSELLPPKSLKISIRQGQGRKTDGAESGTTAEKRKTTATIAPKATGTPWPWSSQGVLTKEALDVSGSVDDPEDLDAVGERAVEDETALEALHGQARTEEKRGFRKLLCAPSSGIWANAGKLRLEARRKRRATSTLAFSPRNTK